MMGGGGKRGGGLGTSAIVSTLHIFNKNNFTMRKLEYK